MMKKIPTKQSETEKQSNENTTGTLHFDGGSRLNSTSAAYGFVLEIGSTLVEESEHIGHGTNNQAEYAGLVAGLSKAREMGVTKIHAFGDSELIVKQVTGEYAAKHENIRPLYERAKELIPEFDEFTIEHLYRDENCRADKLTKQELD
ncbi:ribonuclease HI family protein [Halogeometricum sp. S1BR25-6]|uniref:Ribonuclease HI family protein n=1 Tax=Halogeometricum salsisoli TaxID=2950536 RepID=A0ABU2GEZ8_9EURY|nr:ribonuclease HI family protein [Halogeometricum sp. S1BR25-6]MDS0299380.1 ribonuclease HI family protein [Halogeometricum sp. S1BR25-6]